MIFWKDRDSGMRVSSSTKSRQMQGRTEGGRPGPQPHPAERWAPGPTQIAPQVQPKARPKARWLGLSPWSSLTREAVLASQTCSDPRPGRVSPGVGSAQSGVGGHLFDVWRPFAPLAVKLGCGRMGCGAEREGAASLSWMWR